MISTFLTYSSALFIYFFGRYSILNGEIIIINELLRLTIIGKYCKSSENVSNLVQITAVTGHLSNYTLEFSKYYLL